MVKRRSFEDGLTADEETFLKKGRKKSRARKSKAETRPKSQPKTGEPDMSKSALKERTPAESPQTEVARPLTSVGPSYLSVRIDPRIAASYLRAMTERRIEGRAPWTQQDIVAEAMTDWLKKHGYFR